MGGDSEGSEFDGVHFFRGRVGADRYEFVGAIRFVGEVGALSGEEFLQERGFACIGKAIGKVFEGSGHPGSVIVGFRKYARGGNAGGLYKLDVVEEDQCLQRRVGLRAFDGTDFAGGGIKSHHVGKRGGPFPYGVHRAAVERLPCTLAVRRAHAVVFPPEILSGLVGADRGATGFGVEQAASGEYAVAKGFGIEPLNGSAGQKDVLRIFGGEVRSEDRILAVGFAEDEIS